MVENKKNDSSEVAIVKSPSYNFSNVDNSVKECINLLGGIKKFVKKGNKVLIKPNLLAAKPPGFAVTTHPSIVKSIVNIVLEAGGKPYIGDSPAIGSWKNIVEKTQMKDVSNSTGAELIPFSKSVRVQKDKNKIFKRIEVADIINNVDVIINLPKLKTHSQMFLTLGVKNLFGFIVGKRKPKLHMEAGCDPLYFATMLIELYQAIKPSFTILDGITGMEGNGPGSGDPKHIGLIMGAVDCVALDRVVCEILGAEKTKLFTTVAAEKLNEGETDLKQINILGEKINNVKVDNFKFPNVGDIEFGPKILRKYIKDFFTTKPIEEKKNCTLCEYCISACPPKIITIKKKRLLIDYNKCIRCYCCVEVCPCGAMGIKKGWIVKVLGMV